MGKQSKAGAEDKKVFLVAQEIELAKLLAGNNTHARERTLKNLKKWFATRNRVIPFGEDDFQRIWKGLFYTMWMSDKPLIQEACAENIASLVHFPSLQNSLLFFKSGLETLINEWFGIDQLRLDKFLMLVRRLLRHMFMSLKEHGFNKINIELFNNVLEATILSSSRDVPLGLLMHFCEIFLEELAKVSEGRIHPNCVVDILQPFIKKLVVTSDIRPVGYIRKFIFTYLIRQSNLGLEYQEKYNAWRQLGFPGSIKSMQKVKVNKKEKITSDEETEKDIAQKEKPLDPRAGRIDVELPQLNFNAKYLASALLAHKFDTGSTKKTRYTITVLANQFAKLSDNKYPLGTKTVVVQEDNYDTDIRKAAKRLIKFEQKLMSRDKKRKKGKENEEAVERKRQKMEYTEPLSEDSEEKEEKATKVQSSKQKKTKNKLKSDLFNSNKAAKLHKEQKDDQGIDSHKSSIKRNEDKVKDSYSEMSGVQKKVVLKDKNLRVKTTVKKAKNKIKSSKKQVRIDIDCIFARNSGTWVVYNVKGKTNKATVPTQIGDPVDSSTAIESVDTSGNSTNTYNEITEIVKKTIAIPDTPRSTLSRPKSEINSTDKISSSIGKKTKLNNPSPAEGLFPKFEWEEQYKQDFKDTYKMNSHNSSKIGKNMNNISYKQKLRGKNRLSLDPNFLTKSLDSKLVKENGTSLILLQQKVKGKNRLSLDPNLVANPFQLNNKPKKVKINTKLNISQEIHEHHRQILKSPGIPYDANKKPLKPLLKTPVKTTPINPFYNGFLNMW